MRSRSRRPYTSTPSTTDEQNYSYAPEAPAPRALVPQRVRFVSETDTEYLVGELRGPRTAVIPKRRARSDPFPLTAAEHARGRHLLRWSLFALVCAPCGGVLGILLGSAVVVVALVRLTNYSGKVRRWRRHAHNEQAQLPAAATSERLCLLAALGQGVVAMMAGSLIVLLLAGLL